MRSTPRHKAHKYCLSIMVANSWQNFPASPEEKFVLIKARINKNFTNFDTDISFNCSLILVKLYQKCHLTKVGNFFSQQPNFITLKGVGNTGRMANKCRQIFLQAFFYREAGRCFGIYMFINSCIVRMISTYLTYDRIHNILYIDNSHNTLNKKAKEDFGGDKIL
jgi:hypothetical protein